MGRERGREPGLPQNSCFISMRLYTAGERVVPGEPPLNCPPLVIQGVDGAQIGTCATNLTQRAWPLAILARWMLSVLRYPPLFHHFFFGFASQCGSLHRSVFTIVCGTAPKSFCLCSVTADKAGLLQNASNGSLALAGASSPVPLSPQDTCELPWLWLARQPG